jgi:CHAT domain-containing protein
VTQAIAREQPAIQAVAKQMNAGQMHQAQKAMGEIMQRITKQLGGNAPPSLAMAVLQAVGTARAAAGFGRPGSGAPLPPGTPDYMRQIMSGESTQAIIDAARLAETDPQAASAAMQKGIDGLAPVLRMLHATAGPAQAAEASSMMRFQIDLAVSSAVKAPQDAETVANGFGALVSRRAEMLELERRISAALGEGDPETVAKARIAWFALNDRIATLELQRANDVVLTDDEAATLAKAKADSAQLMNKLAGVSQRGRSQDAEIDPSSAPADLRATLRPNEALISYAQYATGGKPGKLEYAYAAFILTKSDLQLVDLGPAPAIEAAVFDFLEAVGKRATSLESKTKAARALHDRAFAPIASKLGTAVSALRVVGDGALQLVPFAALHDGKDFLIATRRISYATAERDLLPRYYPPATPSAPLVVGDLPYGTGAVAFAKRFTPQDFRRLASTADEVKAVGAALPGARVVSGPFTDVALLRMRAPRVLHIAAHGVLLPFPLASDAPAAERGLLLERRERRVAVSDASAKDRTDPLARAALVLSASDKPQTDGFLTALEVSALDLWGTELVVLSACDTGRGRTGAAQGVRGFRSAFASAGARSLVTGLWTVDDKATADLMTAFYGALGKSTPRGVALHDAMLALRKTQPDPYYWAPFVLFGEDGALGAAGASAAGIAATQATPTSVPLDAERAKRLKRGIEHRRMMHGEAKSAGTGSWSVGGRDDQLLDASAENGLGPRQNNLMLTLQGSHSALTFLISGYRGPGKYLIGDKSTGVLRAVRDPLSEDPRRMSSEDPLPRVVGVVVVTRDSRSQIAGTFTLSGSGGGMKGSFDANVNH